MHLTKCDVCGKTLKKGESKLGFSGSLIKGWNVDACAKCAAPHLALLKKHGLVETKDRA